MVNLENKTLDNENTIESGGNFFDNNVNIPKLPEVKNNIFLEYPVLVDIKKDVENYFTNEFKNEKFDGKNFDKIAEDLIFYLQKDYSPNEVNNIISDQLGKIIKEGMVDNINDYTGSFSLIFIRKLTLTKLENKELELESKEAGLENKELELESKEAGLENKELELERKEVEVENYVKIEKNINNNIADKTGEVADKTEEVADETEEVADETEEVADKTEKEIISNTERINGITNLRLALNNDDGVFTIDDASEGFQDTLKTLNTQQAIIDLKLSEEDKLSYAKNLFVYQKIGSIAVEERTEQQNKFVQEFDKINENLNIDLSLFEGINIVKMFSSSNNRQPETMSTKSFTLNNISENVVSNGEIDNFIKGDTKQAIPQKSNKKTIENNISSEFQDYVKYLNNDGSAVDENKIKNDLSIIDENKRANLLSGVAEVNKQIKNTLDKDKETNSLIKERIIVNCFKHISIYLSNSGFSEKIKVDINKDIKLTENPMTIHVQGDMDGDHIGLHYDLEKGELSMDDFMAYDDKKRFFIGKGHNKQELLKGVKLPTYKQLEENAKKIDFSNKIKSTKSLDDYKENVKSSLDDKISNSFRNESVNRFYIERFNEKNVAEQTILKDIFANWSKNSGGGNIVNFEGSEEIGSEKPNQYKMVKLIYNTLENFRDPDDLRKFQTSIAKLNKLIETNRQDTTGSIKDPVFHRLFNEKSMKTSKEKRKDDSKSKKKVDFDYEINYLTFFDMMSQTKKNTKGEAMIDVSTFEKVLSVLDDNQEELKDNTKFSGGSENIAFLSRYDQEYSKYIDEELKEKLDEDLKKTLDKFKNPRL